MQTDISDSGESGFGAPLCCTTPRTACVLVCHFTSQLPQEFMFTLMFLNYHEIIKLCSPLGKKGEKIIAYLFKEFH